MSEIAKAKERACELALALIHSDEDYLDHVTELCVLGNRIYSEVWTTEFHIFGVLSSDMDHLPLAHVRPRCSEAMLKRADQEIVEIIAANRSEIQSACNEILSKHSAT